MAYSDFDLKTALHTFGLSKDVDTDLFANVAPLEVSANLRSWLDEFAPVALGINSEQARREYIIAPILAEAKRRSKTRVNVLPGVTFDVDRALGLTGYCDYLIARSAAIYYVEAPAIAIVEAKKEDLVGGLGQCAAELVALQLFNEREGTPLPAAFGCVTSGNIWRFLKLEAKTLFIDLPEYYLDDVAKILGIFVTIAEGKDSTVASGVGQSS
jgi:hypothetical protein